MLNWRGAEFGRARPIVAALVAILLWCILSATLAQSEVVAWRFIEFFAKIVLPFIIGMTLLDSMEKLKILAWVIMLSQAFVAIEMNIAYYEGYNRLYFDGFGGMDNNSAAIGMVTCLGLAFFLGLYSEPLWLKLVAFAGGAVIGHSILIAMSRGGMLAIVVTGAVTLLLIPKRLSHYAAFAFAVAVGLFLAGPEVRERFMTLFASEKERDASAASRLELWAGCWKAMKNNPVLGVGPDHWPLVAHEYGFPRGKEAHSLWLQFGAEVGFPGLALLALFYGLCVVRLWPLARGKLDADDPWFRYLAAMVIASLIGFAVSAQFVSLKLLEVPYYVALLGAGTLQLASRPEPVAESVSRNVLSIPGTV
jgi:probable O-glycosylation ligase (exosortase A-associated)